MSLANERPIAFIPTAKPDAARAFYENILGLTFESADPFATVYRIGSAPGQMLRVVRTPDFAPVPYTIFGWQVDDIATNIKELSAKGVEFLRYGFFEQDELGVWTAPGGAKVAWFKDPDGNTLSLSQHP
jgi:predicted enzyme related to lactoylglutathione lyase